MSQVCTVENLEQEAAGTLVGQPGEGAARCLLFLFPICGVVWCSGIHKSGTVCKTEATNKVKAVPVTGEQKEHR